LIDSTVGTLYLVRHGQASFGAQDYDNLSDLGAEQATHLGQWFHAAAVAPSKIVCGGLRRHQQTCRAWAEGFQEAGGQLPAAQHQTIDARWNEYDHEDIFSQGTQSFGLVCVQNKDMPRRDFQRLFEKTISRWISGDHDQCYREPWPHFDARCRAALGDVQKLKGEVVVVFSSGGAIAACVAAALGLSAAQAMQFNYLIANCSVSKFIYRDDALNLATFNNYALFETNPKLLTYR
jgi:broad specificity phosphatase PhoE